MKHYHSVECNHEFQLGDSCSSVLSLFESESRWRRPSKRPNQLAFLASTPYKTFLIYKFRNFHTINGLLSSFVPLQFGCNYNMYDSLIQEFISAWSSFFIARELNIERSNPRLVHASSPTGLGHKKLDIKNLKIKPGRPTYLVSSTKVHGPSI